MLLCVLPIEGGPADGPARVYVPRQLQRGPYVEATGVAVVLRRQHHDIGNTSNAAASERTTRLAFAGGAVRTANYRGEGGNRSYSHPNYLYNSW